MERRSHILMQNIVLACWVLLLLISLAACGAAQHPPTSTPSLPSATEAPSTTPSRTPTPTRTATITPTPTATPVRFPFPHYDLPGWMGDPQTDILADWIMREAGQDELSFLNAGTGEWYGIQVPAETARYFWFDNMHFGFLSNDLQTMYLIDVSTGQVSQESVPGTATRLLEANSHLGVLRIGQDPLSPDDYLFREAGWYAGILISSDGRYSAERISQGESTVVVTDIATGQVVWESNPADGFSDNAFAWSPVNGRFLAIVKGSRDMTNYELPINNTTLIVLDVVTGEIVTSLEDDIGQIIWSPDGTMILYQDALSNYFNFGYGFTDAPCIFNIRTDERECIWNIPHRPVPDGYSMLTTDDYQWSLDGKSIYFDYLYSSHDGMIGNFCMYSLVDGNFTCPTETLAELPTWDVNWSFGWNIQSHSLSPNGEYVWFCFSSNSSLSDDQSGPSVNGLMDINRTRVVTWAGQEFGGSHPIGKCSIFSPIWRPLP